MLFENIDSAEILEYYMAQLKVSPIFTSKYGSRKINLMRIAEIGSNRFHSKMPSIGFRSQETFTDFDAVIIDLNCIVASYGNIIHNESILSNKIINDIRTDIHIRDEQINTLLEIGRYVFIYLPAPIACFSEGIELYLTY